MQALAILLILQAVPPATRDHFPETTPSHVFLVVDVGSGDVVRADDVREAERGDFPAGHGARVLLTLAGLEEGLLDPDRRVACDSTCWGNGLHGEPALAEALAFACDTWLSGAEGRIPEETLARRAAAAGFSRPGAGDSPLGERWRVTARQWADFWARVTRGGLGLRTDTASTLLAAGGLAVASPRGSARALNDPSHRVRAIVGTGGEGTWVTGTLARRASIRWSFALFVRGGSPGLAAARAATLLDQTVRIYEDSTAERGGDPPAPFDADR